MKKIALALLALVLFAAPIAARWYCLYREPYEPGSVPRPDVTLIRAPVLPVEPFDDRYEVLPPGIILVDRVHDNRFEMAELSILQARLAARGQRFEPVSAADSPAELAKQLRDARALVIISPGQDWTAREIEPVVEFVEKGGRLLLIGDPTRYDLRFEEFDGLEYFAGYDYDASHLNDLAARFGLTFEADYLYNTIDNEGNFRNIKLEDFAPQLLTRDLEQVVFYATRSIASDQTALIRTAGETRSSASERTGDLTVAALAADGAVLALGDLTFMTQPYNEAYDNDRLISNIADFLSGSQRRYELEDFPFFFGEQVDLVYTGDPLLDSDLVRSGGALQDQLGAVGRELALRESQDMTHDTLFLGLYQEAEEVESYLASAQVTLLITTTQAVGGQAELIPPPVEPPTATETVTPSLAITLAQVGETVQEAGPTLTTPVTPSLKSRVQIESLGEMVITGTALLLLQRDGDRQVLIVLADTEAGLDGAVKRLSEGDLSGCLLRDLDSRAMDTLALCPSGEIAKGSGDGGWEEPEVLPSVPPPQIDGTGPITGTEEQGEPVGQVPNRILVISLDEGKGRYDSMASAEIYLSILQEAYDVRIWSEAVDGIPEPDDLVDFDLLIWSAGDFQDAVGAEEQDLLFFAVLEGIPTILSGAYIGDADEQTVQRDVEVWDASHPMARGFQEGEVIGFVPAPSGSDYALDLMDATEDDRVIFVRGPDSANAGAPSVLAISDEELEIRFALIGFPLYLLPPEAGARLITNTAGWMLDMLP